MPKKRKKIVRQETTNLYEYLELDLLGLIALFLDYRDIYNLIRVSKFFYVRFSKGENALFKKSNFIRSLVQRDINRHFCPINFETLYTKDEKDRIQLGRLNDDLYKVLHIVNEKKVDLFKHALTILKPLLSLHEAKYLLTQLMRAFGNKSDRFYDRKITLMCVGYSAFFYLREPNLENTLTFIFFLSTVSPFAGEIIYDLFQYLKQEKNKLTVDTTWEQIVIKINELLDSNQIKHKSDKFMISPPGYNEILASLSENIINFIPELDEHFKKVDLMIKLKFLNVFSRFRSVNLLQQLIKYSLLPIIFNLKDIIFLIALFSEKRHWVFDTYKEASINQLIDLEVYIGSTHRGLSYESVFSILDDDVFKEKVIKEKGKLRHLYVDYFMANNKVLLEPYKSHMNKNKYRNTTIRYLIIVKLLKIEERLLKLTRFFDIDDALKIARCSVLETVDAIINKYEKHNDLKNLKLSFVHTDILNLFTKMSDVTVQAILKYIDSITLDQWHQLKNFTKTFIFELHENAKSHKDVNYVANVFAKFPVQTIEFIKYRQQLSIIINYFYETPLFAMLSGEQLKACNDNVLGRMVQMTNLEFQHRFIEALLKRFQGKKFQPKEENVDEIIKELQKDNPMPMQKQNRSKITDVASALATTGFFALREMREVNLVINNRIYLQGFNTNINEHDLNEPNLQISVLWEEDESSSNKRKPDDKVDNIDNDRHKKSKHEDNEEDHPDSKPPRL